MTLHNSSVVRNEGCTLNHWSYSDEGGGIYNAGGTLTLTNSLLADNGENAKYSADCMGDAGGTYNLVKNPCDDAGDCGAVCGLSDPTNIFGIDPKLRELADNRTDTLIRGLMVSDAADGSEVGVELQCPSRKRRRVVDFTCRSSELFSVYARMTPRFSPC